ncbi:MAG: DUF2058 domain-containing protein [Gammaproteobacteria bacterium]|nr:DUF2058 domain-containing protein [Gammaproteobacteria bacterium]MDP2141807.1 DUF2058 domain-containing protein [Gammaproteobacteria bacterium]MDP2348029.1 DUF2058 domain-containing protein [Gammaproteobacteria bacterium]
MAISLQEQLLKAGLVKEKQLKKSNSEKRKQTRAQQHSKVGVVDETREAALKTLAEKADRDRQLAREQNKAAEARAIAAQIRQIITMNRQPKNNGDVVYNFVDDRKIKSLHVDNLTLEHLSLGLLAIVKLDDKYEIVPQAAALKIQLRDPSFVIVCNEQQKAADGTAEDDPYADFKVPDDLMW